MFDLHAWWLANYKSNFVVDSTIDHCRSLCAFTFYYRFCICQCDWVGPLLKCTLINMFWTVPCFHWKKETNCIIGHIKDGTFCRERWKGSKVWLKFSGKTKNGKKFNPFWKTERAVATMCGARFCRSMKPIASNEFKLFNIIPWCCQGVNLSSVVILLVFSFSASNAQKCS